MIGREIMKGDENSKVVEKGKAEEIKRKIMKRKQKENCKKGVKQ